MLNKIPQIDEIQASRELQEGSVLVVDCKKANYRLLNASGSFLWKEIDGEKDVATLADLLAEKYDLDKDTAVSDTEIFLKSMDSRKMLSWKQ